MPEAAKFADRREAAEKLADALAGRGLIRPLVLGIPRGGVPLAKIVAERLGGDLDIILVHKIGHPRHPEVAVGSVTEDGDVLLGSVADEQGLSRADVEDQARAEIAELKRRRSLFAAGRRPADPAGRDVVVVDDGIATGATAEAAVAALKEKEARRLIVAAPVAGDEAVRRLEKAGAEVVALLAPAFFYSVSQFYDDFGQVETADVVAALTGASPPRRPKTPANTSPSRDRADR